MNRQQDGDRRSDHRLTKGDGLAEIMAAWPALPQAVKVEMLRLVRG